MLKIKIGLNILLPYYFYFEVYIGPLLIFFLQISPFNWYHVSPFYANSWFCSTRFI